MSRLGRYVVGADARTADKSDRELQLTTREFDLLAFLAGHPGQTFNNEQLHRRIRAWDFRDTSTVKEHVRRLREKLERDSDPRIVLTVGRAGYRMPRKDDAVTDGGPPGTAAAEVQPL